MEWISKNNAGQDGLANFTSSAALVHCLMTNTSSKVHLPYIQTSTAANGVTTVCLEGELCQNQRYTPDCDEYNKYLTQ